MGTTMRGPFTGQTGQRVFIGPTDPVSDIPVVMDFEHHQNHEGEIFNYQTFATLGVAGSLDIRILTAASAIGIRAPHLVVEAIVDNASDVYLYEGTTFTSPGTLTPAVCRHRQILHNADTQIYVSGGTVLTPNVLGTLLWRGLTTANFNKAPLGQRSAEEWILKPSTDYLFRVTSVGATTRTLMRISFYEDEGV